MTSPLHITIQSLKDSGLPYEEGEKLKFPLQNIKDTLHRPTIFTLRRNFNFVRVEKEKKRDEYRYRLWCILVLGSADVMGNIAGRAWEGRQSAVPRGKIFLKQGPKQGILVLFEQIVRCGGGHWICANIWVTNKLKTGGSNTIIA